MRSITWQMLRICLGHFRRFLVAKILLNLERYSTRKLRLKTECIIPVQLYLMVSKEVGVSDWSAGWWQLVTRHDLVAACWWTSSNIRFHLLETCWFCQEPNGIISCKGMGYNRVMNETYLHTVRDIALFLTLTVDKSANTKYSKRSFKRLHVPNTTSSADGTLFHELMHILKTLFQRSCTFIAKGPCSTKSSYINILSIARMICDTEKVAIDGLLVGLHE